MSSSFRLAAVLQTISVATERILPTLLQSPTLATLYDTVIALNPGVTAFWMIPFFAVLQLALSILTRSYAWNDRLWSLIPPAFALLFLLHAPLSADRRTASLPDVRLAIMSSLVILWGCRLTFNAARRGFYTPGFYDYRYVWLRRKYCPNRFIFSVSYAMFSCGLMSILLALITAPLYFAWVARGGRPSLNMLDAVATFGFLFFTALETVADNQQSAFQIRKAAWHELAPDEHEEEAMRRPELRDGFCQSGLFGWSRHPNYFSEMAIWWSFYVFTLACGAPLLNWGITGAVMYTLLFQATTPLTERISSEKYSAYRDYQLRVSRLIPSPFSRPVQMPEDAKSKTD